MKIWMDDVRELPSGRNGWVWMKTGEEVIEALNSGDVKEISFDHDLGDGMSGYDVAKVIERMAFDGELEPIVWNIHSANLVGRKNIEMAMMKAEQFWSLEEELDEEEEPRQGKVVWK